MRQKLFVYLAVLSLIFQPLLLAEKVRYVIDGDTFILADNQRVRMIGINAPETSHPRYGKMKGQSFGNESKKYLNQLIQGQEVILKNGEEPYDRFGRKLAYVYLSDGTFVNRKLIEEGYAETFRKFPFKYKQEFFEIEKRAQAAKRGMWAGKAPEPPEPEWVGSLRKFMKRFK